MLYFVTEMHTKYFWEAVYVIFSEILHIRFHDKYLFFLNHV